jgi:hypothetical protein
VKYAAVASDFVPAKAETDDFLRSATFSKLLDFAITYELKDPFKGPSENGSRIEITADAWIHLDPADVKDWNHMFTDWSRSGKPTFGQVPNQQGGNIAAAWSGTLAGWLTKGLPNQSDEMAFVRSRHWMQSDKHPKWHETTGLYGKDVKDGNFPRSHIWHASRTPQGISNFQATSKMYKIIIDNCQEGKIQTWIQYPDHKVIGDWVNDSAARYYHYPWKVDIHGDGPSVIESRDKKWLDGYVDDYSHDGFK